MNTLSVLLSLLLVFISVASTTPEVLAGDFCQAPCLEEKAQVFGDVIARQRVAPEDAEGGPLFFSAFCRGSMSYWAFPHLVEEGGKTLLQAIFVPGLPLFLLFGKLIFYF